MYVIVRDTYNLGISAKYPTKHIFIFKWINLLNNGTNSIKLWSIRFLFSFFMIKFYINESRDRKELKK